MTSKTYAIAADRGGFDMPDAPLSNLMHTSDSAGSISATINVSHQSHLLRSRRYFMAQSGCSANPLESAFEMRESNSGCPDHTGPARSVGGVGAL